MTRDQSMIDYRYYYFVNQMFAVMRTVGEGEIII